MKLSHTTAININNLTVIYNEQPVLFGVNAQIAAGSLLGIIGPNGAGKTTLLKSILGIVKPIAGTITIFGSTIHYKKHLIGYVPQRTAVDWDFPIRVFDVVLMGCYGRLGWFKRPADSDHQKAWDALKKVGMTAFAQRPIAHLSGGQQQRVFLARALAQDAGIYLLDEPFNGIDSGTEKIVVTILKQLSAAGKTILVVHHDLQTLAEYFDSLLLLNVTCIAHGNVHEVLKPEYICSVYGNTNLFTPTFKS